MVGLVLMLNTGVWSHRPRILSKQVGGSLPTPQRSRRGKQIDPSGVDFSGCQEDPETGFCCVEKLEQVTLEVQYKPFYGPDYVHSGCSVLIQLLLCICLQNFI